MTLNYALVNTSILYKLIVELSNNHLKSVEEICEYLRGMTVPELVDIVERKVLFKKYGSLRDFWEKKLSKKKNSKKESTKKPLSDDQIKHSIDKILTLTSYKIKLMKKVKTFHLSVGLKHIISALEESDWDYQKAQDAICTKLAKKVSKKSALEINELMLHQGKRKALIIGINYYYQPLALKGCVGDAHRFREMLANVFQFPANKDCIRMLFDENQSDYTLNPTRDHIIEGIKWLISDAKPGDSLVMTYSGHGISVPDKNADEKDGFDEAIVPIDHEFNGNIIDDELYDLIVSPLPEGVKLTVIMDCCRSGSALDLPFVFDITSGKWFRENNNKHSHLDVQMISGCADDQLSLDLQIKADSSSFGVEYGGALSLAVISKLYNKSEKLSILDFVKDINKSMVLQSFTQAPLYSSSYCRDMSQPFRLLYSNEADRSSKSLDNLELANRKEIEKRVKLAFEKKRKFIECNKYRISAEEVQ